MRKALSIAQKGKVNTDPGSKDNVPKFILES